jgi:dipeptidyl aminopeptidase/acylaminoacyl peptidase
MKRSLLTVLLTAAVYGAFAQATVTEADYRRAEGMLNYKTSSLVDGSNVRPTWLPDGRFYYGVLRAEGPEYVLIDPKTASRKSDRVLSTLIGEDKTPKPDVGRYEVLSPDMSKVAFIRDWSLWMRDLSSKKETQLTTDGVENFGYATDNAGWTHSDNAIVAWSPDSKKIATFQQDQRHVSNMYLVTTNVGAPRLEAWKYPLPEDKDIIRIHRVIIDVESGKMVRLHMAPDARRSTLCDDISCDGDFTDVAWSPDAAQLAFVSSSRDHKEAKLRITDVSTGGVRDVYEEKVATQYESGQGSSNWRFFPASNEFIWYSEKDDWGHLYLHDLTTGKLKNQITKGPWVVTRLIRVDEKKRILYFEAQGKEPGRDPYFSHFYSIGFDGKNLKLLTPDDGHHLIFPSEDGKYFVDSYSKPDVPPVAVLRDITGKLILTLEKADISRLVKSGWKAPVPITTKSDDGKWDLYGLMFAPTNLDPSRKYPVINYIYPGPQSGGVGSRTFSPSRGDHQALAELGCIVIVIDGTCNPGRSKSFHDACYGNIGVNTIPDQIAGIRQLASKYPFIDATQVGVWGHSGGGFAAGTAMLRYPEFYKVGISESGNHDNRNYEGDWGERYIGLMRTDASGRDNYESQANQMYARNLKGKLMLIHGGMDDNVPPYSTYLVVDSLVKANKDFDLVILPNARHGYGQDNYYIMRRRWDYFVTHLLHAVPSKEYLLKPSTDPRLRR